MRTTGHWLRRFALVLLLGLLAASAWTAYALESGKISPRQLSRHILNRAQGSHAVIVAAGNFVADVLVRLDRGHPYSPQVRQFRSGAQPEPVASAAPADVLAVVPVKSSAEAIEAFEHASPGAVITFLPGVYRFDGARVGIDRPGTQQRRIVVRADRPGTVTLEMATVEGFLIAAPYWSFENLTITGICSEHSNCEHAFHIVGNATGFIARNNTISDFNAHFKINAVNDMVPDNGLIEGNTLTNRSVRRTANPVTPIDLVVASRWTIRKNLITDFLKGEGNRISYGAFAKGGGNHNVFENNIILCEHLLRAPGTQAVGLSLGGGGTGPQFCRDRRCVTEQDHGTIRGNLIASCSEEGIYLNRAATSRIIHNTLIDTAGISVRFPASSADIEGNLIDGQIRARDGAILRETDNTDTSTLRLFVGLHPVAAMVGANGITEPGATIPRRAADRIAEVGDLCGAVTTGQRTYGAFANFKECLR